MKPERAKNFYSKHLKTACSRSNTPDMAVSSNEVIRNRLVLLQISKMKEK